MNPEQTEQRILKAATEVFAREGYAGAHVAEIAERAEVNVALIYRYFGSKEQLLQAVIGTLIEDDRAQRDKVYGEQPMPSSPEQIMAMLTWGYDYLSQRRDLLKIILLESLRGDEFGSLLFQAFDTSVLSRFPTALVGRRDDEALDALIGAFFLGAMPLWMAVVYGEQWSAHYGVEPERFREHILSLVSRMYVPYILERLESARQEQEREDP